MKKTIYITTSIPYVNASPHIGYALEVVQADTLARYYRLLGKDTYFMAGTDENAIKNVEAAEKQNLTTQELVDRNAQTFYKLKAPYNLTFDGFIRTSSAEHKIGAQAFWNQCKHRNPDDIYEKDYTGLYCTGCETFYKDGEFEKNICPLHNRPLETVTEKNWFFRLSKYETALRDLIESNKIIIASPKKKHAVQALIELGLEDFSISRPLERTKGWGIPVPGDDSQRMYVWFDALTNYINGLGYGQPDDALYQKYWVNSKERIHIIGKDIVKFHAIYWPAMLLSAGVPLPTTIFVHGFINVEGKKMSKSLGNVVDPFVLVKKYGTDAVRYYLLREIPALDDGDYSDSRMQQVYNTDLANELGNLLLRVTTLSAKDLLEVANRSSHPYDNGSASLFESFQFNAILENIWKEIKALNREIDGFAPWKKTPAERQHFLLASLDKLWEIGNLLHPFLPQAAAAIVDACQGKIRKIDPLFPKSG